MSICKCVNVCMCVGVSVCMYVRMYVCMYVCGRKKKYIYIYIDFSTYSSISSLYFIIFSGQLYSECLYLILKALSDL